MDIVNVTFHAFFLILGISLIIGYSSLAIYYKIKYPDKKWKYKYAPLFFLFGISFIIGAITGYTRVVLLLIMVFGGFYILYTEKKYPEKYKSFLSFKMKILLVFVMFIAIIQLLAFFLIFLN